MAIIPVSQFSPAANLDGTEIVPVVQSGVTVRTTTQAIAALAPGGGGGGGGGGAVSSVFGRTGAVTAQTGDYSYEQISGKPTLATVATSGAYSDLSGKPATTAFAAVAVGTTAQYMRGDATLQTFPTIPTTTAFADVAVGTAAQYMRGDATLQTFPTIPSAAAQISFTQSGTGAIARTVDAKLKDGPISVLDFGADPTGAADSTTAIQAAIDALPSGGGVVLVPPGAYKISSTITLGNGTATTQSTVNGIVITGPTPNMGYDNANSPILNWAGSTGTMLEVNGPINGWGISNLTLNGASTATTGIQITSGSFGAINNVLVEEFTALHVGFTTQPDGGTGFKGCTGNIVTGLTLTLPNTANVVGMTLDAAAASNNTSINTFNNLNIEMPAGANVMTGLILRGCDTNQFNNCLILAQDTTNTATKGIVFDYTGAQPVWPADNTFFLLGNAMLFNPAGAYTVVGTPGGSGGSSASSSPNRVFGVSGCNHVMPPQVANTAYSPEVLAPAVTIVSQSAGANIPFTTLAATASWQAPMVMFRINYYMRTNTIGGSQVQALFNWTDPTGVNQSQTIPILDTSNNTATIEGSFIVVAGPNTGVGYEVDLKSGDSTGTYTLCITTEKLT